MVSDKTIDFHYFFKPFDEWITEYDQILRENEKVEPESVVLDQEIGDVNLEEKME
jgi:hypothetical protein